MPNYNVHAFHAYAYVIKHPLISFSLGNTSANQHSVYAELKSYHLLFKVRIRTDFIIIL